MDLKFDELKDYARKGGNASDEVMQTLFEEIRRLQAENAALREALAKVHAVGHFDHAGHTAARLSHAIYEMKAIAAAALDTKPDAAPVEPLAREIAVGDMVRIVKEGSYYYGHEGVVKQRSVADDMYFVATPSGRSPSSWVDPINCFKRNEIEPA